MSYQLKITGLTLNNTDALEIVRDELLAQPGVHDVTITRTTAVFRVDAPHQARRAVLNVTADLPGRGHPRASLHAVARKLIAGWSSLPN